jgi:hypothetical protein
MRSIDMRSIDAAWQEDPVELTLYGEAALAYLRSHLPEDDPFRQHCEIRHWLGNRVELHISSELHYHC